ncbi:hypothetical protein KY362_04465 [Candidatus Woesearchaeota archaeon]|nr:hypothetical protein [Candidatus Woesearchaeota archaeon]
MSRKKELETELNVLKSRHSIDLSARGIGCGLTGFIAGFALAVSTVVGAYACMDVAEVSRASRGERQEPWGAEKVTEQDCASAYRQGYKSVMENGDASIREYRNKCWTKADVKQRTACYDLTRIALGCSESRSDSMADSLVFTDTADACSMTGKAQAGVMLTVCMESDVAGCKGGDCQYLEEQMGVFMDRFRYDIVGL